MMPPEGPNKTEELLQRYAKERREQGGDFSLHPATRRLLQGEVARRFGGPAKEKSGWRAWFGAWRGRLVFAATTALIVASTWMVWNSSKPEPGFQLAKNDRQADLGQLAAEPALRSARTLESDPVDKKLAANSLRFLKEETASGEKQKAANLDVITFSDILVPAQKSPDASRAEMFGASPVTNAADYYAFITPKPQGARNYSIPRPTAPISDLALGVDHLADAQGLAPSDPKTLNDEARYDGVALGKLATNTLLGSGTVSYDVAAARPPVQLGYQNGTAPAQNEFSKSKAQSDIAKTQTAGRTLALSVTDASSLTRERRLDEVQPTGAPATAAPQNIPADALALNEKRTGAATEPKPLGSVTLTADMLVRSNTNAAPVVFFRQSSLGEAEGLAEIDRRGITLQRKAEKTDGEIAPGVLSRFVVEQSGQAIRLVDADGSLYEGVIDTQAVVAASDFELARQRDKDNSVRAQPEALQAVVPRSGQEYSFRASGSNVTLRQIVIVNGRLNAAPDTFSGVNRSGAGGAAFGGTISAPAPATVPSPTRRARGPVAAERVSGQAPTTNATVTIEGTVRVGGAGEQRFKAVRAPR